MRFFFLQLIAMTVLLLLLTVLLETAAGGNFLPTIARLSLASCNEVTLVCQVQTVESFHVEVKNSHFLANDTDIQDLLPFSMGKMQQKGIHDYECMRCLRVRLELTHIYLCSIVVD